MFDAGISGANQMFLFGLVPDKYLDNITNGLKYINERSEQYVVDNPELLDFFMKIHSTKYYRVSMPLIKHWQTRLLTI